MLGTEISADGEKPAPALRTIVPDLDEIEGWLHPQDAEELFRAAAAAASGCIVEIGSYRGRSTLALCAGSSAGAKLPVYAIDPHEETTGVLGGKFGPQDRAAFFRHFTRTDLVRYVRLINTTSTVAACGWDKPVSLLYIDGDHRYPSVYADFAAWEAYLIAGATVVFNNPGMAGPKKVIGDLAAAGTLHFVRQARKLAVFSFVRPRPASDERPAGKPGGARTKPSGRGIDAGHYEVPWQTIGYGVYYGGDGAYLYQPITKCACTTIKTLLLELEGLPVDANEWRRHQKKLNGFPGTNHLSQREQRDIFEGRTNTFKFVFVRNPYSRLASVYCDKVRQQPAPHFINQIRQSGISQGVMPSDPITFEEFVNIISRQKIAEMNPHWRPQYCEGRFAAIKYDFIGRIEMMPSDLVYALETIGAPQAIVERASQRLNATGSSIDLWESVSPEIRKQYLTTFAVDFDAFQYPRRLPGSGAGIQGANHLAAVAAGKPPLPPSEPAPADAVAAVEAARARPPSRRRRRNLRQGEGERKAGRPAAELAEAEASAKT